ncbi:MAG TPA: fibronectin-binding domain-containing protein, partial [Archaeoglobaceae archaeon]|nr:fibronectin-binding domain-containing protein [Archaeoglobaceae archaeon]
MLTKKTMSAVDIWSCVKELQELVDGRINKIYHSGNEIRIKIHAERRFDLLIEAGKRIHLTRFARETKIPSSFAMLLRKHLEGGRIKKIEQYDFDRIVVIEVQRGDETKFLIAELFLKGNIILADSEMNIIMALKKLRPGLRYQFPEERVNPENILDRLQEILENEEVVKVLATKGGLGGLFAEEICIKSGINKKKNANELGGEEIDKIKESIRSTYSPLFSGKLKPHIVVSDNKYVDVLPFELEYYSDFDKKYFPTLNDALDEFYSKEITTEKKDVSIQKLKKRLEKQLEAKENFEKELKLMKETGDTIYENYQTIEEIMNAFKSARKSMSWD